MPDPDALRRLIESQTAPPPPGRKPDLDVLRALLHASPHGPWWVETRATPNGYPPILRGILAASVDDVVSDNDAPHELGRLFPDLACALAVAAVNALPWLIAAVDKAERGDAARREYQAARSRYGPVAQANVLALDRHTFAGLPTGPIDVGDLVGVGFTESDICVGVVWRVEGERISVFTASARNPSPVNRTCTTGRTARLYRKASDVSGPLEPLHGNGSTSHGYIMGVCGDECDNASCRAGHDHDRCTPDCAS